jgi:hypothetical protein
MRHSPAEHHHNNNNGLVVCARMASSPLLRGLVVGFIWGSTNAGLRHVVAPPNQQQNNNNTGIASELGAALRNWKWLGLYSLNQLGSALFYVNLGVSDLSTAVPVSQAFTLLFTTLTALALGERLPQANPYLFVGGCLLILLGVGLMASS